MTIYTVPWDCIKLQVFGYLPLYIIINEAHQPVDQQCTVTYKTVAIFQSYECLRNISTLRNAHSNQTKHENDVIAFVRPNSAEILGLCHSIMKSISHQTQNNILCYQLYVHVLLGSLFTCHMPQSATWSAISENSYGYLCLMKQVISPCNNSGTYCLFIATYGN